MRGIVCAALVGMLGFASPTGAEQLELRCSQDAGEMYVRDGDNVINVDSGDGPGITLSLDLESKTFPWMETPGVFMIDDRSIVAMHASEEHHGVWDIDRASGRVVAVTHSDRGGAWIVNRIEGRCTGPDGVTPF